MFDFRMLILRLASTAAVVYGAREFMHSETSMDDVYGTFSDVSNDVFEWGQNKFLGISDPSQAIQTKKSAREIFAEAFMEDEMFGTSTQFVKFADEEEIKAAYEKEKKAKQQQAEGEQDVDVEIGDIDGEEEAVNVLDSLTLADDDEDDDDTE